MNDDSILQQVIADYTAKEFARLEAGIANEPNPDYRRNRQASLNNQKSWWSCVASGKYVAEGSTDSHGFSVSFTRYFISEAEAVAEVAKFPKFVKVKKSTLRGHGIGFFFHTAEFRVALVSCRVTGASNEAGLKRLRRFLEISGEYAWHNTYCQNFLSVEAFKAALEQEVAA